MQTGAWRAATVPARRCGTMVRMAWFDLGEVAWLGVAIATLAAVIVGFLWYHPRGLGTAWARVAGIEPAELRSGRAIRGVVAVIVLAVTAVGMCVLQAELLVVSIAGGLAFGAVIGLVLRLGWSALHGEYESRPVPLTLIDGAHDVVALAIIGAVLGAFL